MKVVTTVVSGVTAGQELWFANSCFRDADGIINSSYPIGTLGDYWTFNQQSDQNAYAMIFHSSYPAGNPNNYASKLLALSLRCVRLIGLYE